MLRHSLCNSEHSPPLFLYLNLLPRKTANHCKGLSIIFIHIVKMSVKSFLFNFVYCCILVLSIRIVYNNYKNCMEVSNIFSAKIYIYELLRFIVKHGYIRSFITMFLFLFELSLILLQFLSICLLRNYFSTFLDFSCGHESSQPLHFIQCTTCLLL